MTATVANGKRVACPRVNRHAPFSIADTTFHTDLFVMPLVGYVMVLGTRWLGTLGPIVWDFAARSMAFQHRGRALVWSGVPSSSPAQLRTLAAASGTLLDELLATYKDLFSESRGLPPQRSRDHAIVLKPRFAPVAVRLYRYPAAHKDKLERQCAAMIKQGVVRRSDSPFSSPILSRRPTVRGGTSSTASSTPSRTRSRYPSSTNYSTSSTTPTSSPSWICAQGT